MRVLIADDDREFAEALADYVRDCAHEVVATVTGGGAGGDPKFRALRA